MNTKTGSGSKFLDWAVILYAVILFFKTADVLSYFAPTNLNAIIGYDISILYGMLNAFLVEGAALAIHFNPRAQYSSAAQIAKWTFLAISAACQVFDGYITTGTLDTMSDPLQFTLRIGVPLIPLFGMLMLFAVGQLPEIDGTTPKRYVGVKNMIMPKVKRFWNGDEETTTFAEETDKVDEVDKTEKARRVRHD